MKRTLISDITNLGEKGGSISGWITAKTDIGKTSFIYVKDRSGEVQVVFKDRKTDFDALNIGDVVNVQGHAKEDRRAPTGYEFVVSGVNIVAKCEYPTPLPLDHLEDRTKRPDIDKRLEFRYLDLRNPKTANIFKMRSDLTDSLRQNLRRNGFVEIHTPKIVAAATEGGSNLFPIEYFERDAYLAQSPQFYKQLMMASGLERVFEIAPAFRAERHDTTRHLNEFTSVDLEMSFIETEDDVMQMAERVLQDSFRDLKENGRNYSVEITVPQIPFVRLPMKEAYEIANQAGLSLDFGDDLSSRGEEVIGKWAESERKGNFVFLTDFPVELRPLYAMPNEKDPKLTRSFDLLQNGVEIVTGGQRIHDYKMLKAAFEKRHVDPEKYAFYLDAFKYGMPPHGGLGLGLDRLVAQTYGVANIREVVLFPRDKKRLTP